MTITIRLKQTVYWTFRVLVDTWKAVLTRWSSSRAMSCVPSRSGSWSPPSESPSAAAWCRAARPLLCSRHPSGLWVSAQKHREHKRQGNGECALYLSKGNNNNNNNLLHLSSAFLGTQSALHRRGNLLNHHQCAESTWMMRRQPYYHGMPIPETEKVIEKK